MILKVRFWAPVPLLFHQVYPIQFCIPLWTLNANIDTGICDAQFTAGRRHGEHELHARRDRLHQLRGL